MKKHTTYYVVGAVLIGVGAYLYSKKKNADNVVINLNPPAEVKEEDKLPETATPPFVSAYDSIKKLIESLQLGNKQTTNNQTV